MKEGTKMCNQHCDKKRQKCWVTSTGSRKDLCVFSKAIKKYTKLHSQRSGEKKDKNMHSQRSGEKRNKKCVVSAAMKKGKTRVISGRKEKSKNVSSALRLKLHSYSYTRTI